MKYSKQKVEQIDFLGNIVMDYGEILSRKELGTILMKSFPCKIATDGFAYGTYENTYYCLCFKNISYLGTPHPTFKKRIQIPSSFVTAYKNNSHNGIKTFFIGIYKYKDNIVFVNFNTDNYVQNKAHNSSAHVLTIDLSYATMQSIHLKKDARKNEIFCFTPSSVNHFFEMYVLRTTDFTPPLFTIFNTFYDDINHQWNGVDCYKKMMAASYHRSKQPEWAGAYLEFEFENYIQSSSKVQSMVTYAPERSRLGIDLDLYFPLLNEYGDLKAHTSTSTSIIGNKTSTIQQCISGNNSVYYIVFNHESTYDKNYGYTVTEFWNQALHKDNLRSYSNKMKHSVTITSYMILEINEKNYRYLKTDFQQNFKNSDGNKRSGKICISKKVLPNFIIHEYSGENNEP